MDETIALEFHLASCDVEACDQLLIRTGGGMREHRLAELSLNPMKIDILDEQHRTLPNGGHRLMRRVGLVNPKLDLSRIRHQSRFQKLIIRRAGAKLLLLLLIGRKRFRILYPRFDLVRRTHCGPRAKEW